MWRDKTLREEQNGSVHGKCTQGHQTLKLSFDRGIL